MNTLTRCLLACLALVLAHGELAWAQDNHDKWIDVINVDWIVPEPGSGAAATTTGKASLASPPDNPRSPTRLVLDVPMGSLQQQLARAHRQRTSFDVTTRGTDPRGTYLEWKLKRAQVTSYSMSGGADGSVRVVLEAGRGGPAGPDDR